MHFLTRLGVFLLKHFPLTNISEVIGVRPAVDADYIANVRKWREAWNGKMSHNIGKKGEEGIPSLQLAKRASTLVANNVAVGLESEVQGQGIDAFNTDFQKAVNNVRDCVEAVCATHQIIWRPDFDVESGKVVVVTSEAGTYLPLRYNRLGEMVAVVFIEQQKKGDDWYTLLTKCDFIDNRYTIENKAYKGELSRRGAEIPLTSIDAWKDLSPYEEHAASRPWFVELTAPNNEAVFDRALDLIKEADIQESRLSWENEAGEPMVFASGDLFKDVGKKSAANPKQSETKLDIPKNKKRLFNVGNYSPSESKIHLHNPELRNESLDYRKNDIKREIEDILGFPRGSLSKAEIATKTATEVIDGKSNFAVLVETLRERLTVALDSLAVVMFEVGTAAKLYNGKFEIATQYGDFLLTPEQRMAKFREEWATILSGVAQGVVSLIEARAWYKENSETFFKLSKEALKKAEEEMPESLPSEF